MQELSREAVNFRFRWNGKKSFVVTIRYLTLSVFKNHARKEGIAMKSKRFNIVHYENFKKSEKGDSNRNLSWCKRAFKSHLRGFQKLMKMH